MTQTITKVDTCTMTVAERRTLAAAEQDIEKGGSLIVKALKVIRDGKLYRDQHGTFEDYCVERWGMKRAHAYRLISHGKVLEVLSDDPDLSPIGDKITESATREIANLPAETQREVLKEAAVATNGKPTAAAVRKARAQVTGEPEKIVDHKKESLPAGPVQAGVHNPFDAPAPNSAPDKKPDKRLEFDTAKLDGKPSAAASIVLDSEGRIVPAHLREKHGGAAAIQAVASLVERCRTELDKLSEQPGCEYLEGDIAPALDVLLEVKDTLRGSMYACECPVCQGTVQAECERCDGHGFLPRSRAGTLSDAETDWLGARKQANGIKA